MIFLNFLTRIFKNKIAFSMLLHKQRSRKWFSENVLKVAVSKLFSREDSLEKVIMREKTTDFFIFL